MRKELLVDKNSVDKVENGVCSTLREKEENVMIEPDENFEML